MIFTVLSVIGSLCSILGLVATVCEINTNTHLKEDTERRGFFVSGKEDAAGNTRWYFQGG